MLRCFTFIIFVRLPFFTGSFLSRFLQSLSDFFKHLLAQSFNDMSANKRKTTNDGKVKKEMRREKEGKGREGKGGGRERKGEEGRGRKGEKGG